MMQEKNAAGLYIHIPFCVSRCAYCDFFSITNTGLIPRFLDALFKEIEAYHQDFPGFDTIYLGGGTPSVLSVSQIETLLARVRGAFTILPDPEITIEVNPADWERGDLEELHGLGINRISIGVQSLDEKELILLGRRHNPEQAMNAIEDVCHAGFENISVDLIYGLPGQRLDRWIDTLQKALSFNPSHLSCYELELKPDTPLGRRYKKGEFSLQSEENLRVFFMQTSEFLEQAGYIHYEISNFAAGRKMASRHNQKYWDHTPYLGLGPSAHSYNEGRRWWNHESLADYCHDLENGTLPVSDSEVLDIEQLKLETLFLGLRMKKGIDLAQYRSRYGCDLMKERGPVLKQWADAGFIEIDGGFIRPTLSGMAVADALALL
ncbi:MAG TPA: radical SAM family heme chaperone HemW [Deltaproteobacteria bacterium]|nr:radical SAM family heme chaperone HemW [Deltaproteobacteria bacterium]HPR50916.1 radical SAM family heme chaperone HemW [Deltaproteobacteria bacterium]